MLWYLPYVSIKKGIQTVQNPSSSKDLKLCGTRIRISYTQNPDICHIRFSIKVKYSSLTHNGDKVSTWNCQTTVSVIPLADHLSSVCHKVLSADYSVLEWNNCHLLSLKLGVIIRPTNRQNWLTFVGHLVSDTNYGSLTKYMYWILIYLHFSYSHHPIFMTFCEINNAD